MLTVLVIDDEPLVRSIIGRFLRSIGCCVTEAESAEHGLTILDANRFRLALIDANLPGMSGPTMTRHVVARHPETHVVLMSGEDCAWEAAAAGAQGFLGKPFEFSELASFVQRANAAAC